MKKFFIFLLLFCSTAQAGIVVMGTRVIYPGEEKEVTVQLENKGDLPVLIQNWIDNGDTKAKISEISVPFILTPPINRVDPGKGQSLRILKTGNLPNDRESVYWLNILEIPAKSKEQKSQNMLELAFRTRMKIFYRPSGLNSDIRKIIENVELSFNNGDLIVKNTSPYYFNLASINVQSSRDKKINKTITTRDMLPPFESSSFPIELNVKKSDLNIILTHIDDYGRSVENKVDVK